MVQVMEAWLVADSEALKRFYGQDFNAKLIPSNPDVEQIDKTTLFSALKDATRRTAKGEYHKIRHGPEILKLLEASKVQNAARHCQRLFETLERKMSA